MFDTLAGYWKGPKGIRIGRIRGRIQTVDVAAPKELGKGEGNPECIMGILRKTMF